MKPKLQIHEFDPVIYPFKLWVAITNDLKAIEEQFNDYPSGNEFGYMCSEKMLAFTQNVQKKSDGYVGAIIVFRNKSHCSHCTTKIIAHEATHVARIIWDYIGEQTVAMEADAYLVGWIAECCEKVKRNQFTQNNLFSQLLARK